MNLTEEVFSYQVMGASSCYLFGTFQSFGQKVWGQSLWIAQRAWGTFISQPRTRRLAGMPIACYRSCMANIQVKNIPDKLHNRLRRYAREQDCTLGEIILEAIEREVARREWHKRFSGRPTTRVGSSAAELLEQERRQRDSDLP
jgi:hypothetical protein